MIKEVDIYYNPKVIEFLEMVKAIKVFKAGRGSGKTRCIPEDILDRAHELPRARIFLASYSFDAINDNIMPEIREVFEMHGFKEGYDYVVDREPPTDFMRPYRIVEDPRNSIHLFNGFAIQKVSMGRMPKKYRGRSFDGGIIDEALNIKGHDVENILLPTLRGLNRWKDNPYWKMMSIYSSHPRTPEGAWFLKYEKMAQQNPDLYGWVEATALDNLPVVGDDYIDKQKASLNHYDFMIEIMNEGETKNLPTLFYHKYRRSLHNYRAEALSDVEANVPLEFSFDFGGRYSCLTVSQEQNGIESVVHEFDTNNVTEADMIGNRIKKVPDLIDDFNRAFGNKMQNKEILIWGERMGLDRNSMDTENIYQKIQRQLLDLGWTAQIMVSYADSDLHKSRYNFMNDCFEGKLEAYPAIRINEITCPNLCVSLDKTRVRDDFKKDKKDESNQHFNQSHAPHLTDTLDYKIYNKYYYLLDSDEWSTAGMGMGGGIESF